MAREHLVVVGWGGGGGGGGAGSGWTREIDSGGKSTSSKITPSRKWSVADLDESTLIIKRFK